MKIIIACQWAAVMLIIGVAGLMLCDGDYLLTAIFLLIGAGGISVLIAQRRLRR